MIGRNQVVPFAVIGAGWLLGSFITTKPLITVLVALGYGLLGTIVVKSIR